MADSLIFYESFYKALQKLSDEDRLAAYDAICGYGITGELPDIDGIASAIFDMAKPQIDANQKRREDGAKGAEYGKHGGRPKKENPIGVTEKNPIGVIDENPIGVKTETPNVNVNDNANVNVNANANANVNANDNANAKEKAKAKAKEKEKTKTAPAALSDVPELDKAIRDFIEHRKKLKRPMTDHAIDLFVRHLDKMADSVPGKIELIDYAIQKGWLDVYPKNERPPTVRSGTTQVDEWAAALREVDG